MHSDTHDPRAFDALDGLEGALDWWREAGVDCDFSEEATRWLAQPQGADAVTAPPPPAPPMPQRPTPLARALAGGERPAIGGPREAWPGSLEKFREWWMTEPSLADGALDRRIPPRGVAGAKLMVLVPQPEIDDAQGLLTGGAGRLLAAFLNAAGIGEHEVYQASSLPAPLALPDWSELQVRGLGEVAVHHIALARPQRVLAFGRAQMALFGIEGEASREPTLLDSGTAQVPLLAAPELSQIARSAARRRNLWHRWLDWTA